MLLAETGKPLIVHTVEAASASAKASSIVVATDDQQILEAVQAAGHTAEMTRADHQSGSDRIAEVAQRHPDYEIVVNLQGDEPEISGESIDLAISMLEDNPQVMVSTLATPIRSKELLNDPSCVKVVVDGKGRALYFSRSPIPHARTWSDDLLDAGPPAAFLQHVGLYAYRRDLLLKFSSLPPCPNEKLESLEQLRVLSAGYSICVGLVDEPLQGIDTREDYDLFVRNLACG
jgi:3-deoxy-manno-octulosonate cytidylyltransferase (CMP-KDO synthetase)